MSLTSFPTENLTLVLRDFTLPASRWLVLLVATVILIRTILDRRWTIPRMAVSGVALFWFLIGGRYDAPISRYIAGMVAGHPQTMFVVLILLFGASGGLAISALSLEYEREQNERIRRVVERMGKENEWERPTN